MSKHIPFIKKLTFNNKIIDNDFDVIESGYENQPIFSLGYHYYTAQVREKMENNDLRNRKFYLIVNEFENDVLVTSFKIKAHEAYVWLHSKFGRRFKMPPPQEKAIAFCHVAKLLDEKKKMGKSDRSLEERLDSIERLLMKERNTLRKVQSKIEA